MANFEDIVTWLLRIEDAPLRGEVKDLGDGAGLTRFGLTSVNDGALLPSDYFTKDPGAALLDAKNVYRRKYWNAILGDKIEPDEVAASVFSFAVNEWVAPAVKIAQRALGLVADGVVGPQTLKAFAEPGAGDKIREAQASHYRALDAANHARDDQWLTGWLKRAYLKYPDLTGFV